jgi:tripartite-type tricarboxylate transporter receptor subunit TctC
MKTGDDMIARKNFLRRACILGALLAACGGALAQPARFPSKPITVINPYQAGGGSDTIVRLLQNKLAQSLGQPIVVDSKPGATGTLGSEFVARAAPDGHTLLINNITIVINEALGGAPRLDIQRDLVPIATVASSPVAVAVSAQLPVKTLKELVAYARQHEGKVGWSSCGSGSPQHLVGLRFTQALKLSMIHIPYKGCAGAIVDGVSGVVPVLFTTTQNADTQVKAGKLRILAVGGDERLTFQPDVPTFAEALGIKDFDAEVWFAFFAPRGTPPAVVAQLEGALVSAMADKEIQKAFTDRQFAPLVQKSPQLAAQIKSNLAQFKQMKSDFDIKLD